MRIGFGRNVNPRSLWGVIEMTEDKDEIKSDEDFASKLGISIEDYNKAVESTNAAVKIDMPWATLVKYVESWSDIFSPMQMVVCGIILGQYLQYHVDRIELQNIWNSD